MGNSASMSENERPELKNTVKDESLPLNEINVDNIESEHHEAEGKNILNVGYRTLY